MRFTDLVSVINPLISHPKFKACLVHVNHLFPHPIPRDLKSNTGVCITFNNGIPILHNIPIFRIQLNDNFCRIIGGKSTHKYFCLLQTYNEVVQFG